MFIHVALKTGPSSLCEILEHIFIKQNSHQKYYTLHTLGLVKRARSQENVKTLDTFSVFQSLFSF